MSESDVRAEGGGTARLVRKVVVTYRLESDPEETERTFTLAHGGAGEMIDALIWSEELMRKLAYLEADVCRVPKKAPGMGEWKMYSAEQDSTVAADCVWVHDLDCQWWEYCPE